MTRRTNSRVAGFVFLFYIASGIGHIILLAPANRGETTAAKLASLAQHPALARFGAVVSLVMMLNAFVLGIALYALTRDYDRELALLALVCRIVEGSLSVANGSLNRVLIQLAGVGGSDAATANVTAGALMTARSANVLMASTAFAIGSTLFAYLFLRARTIPVWMAWLGVVGSLIVLAGLLLQMLAVIAGTITNLVWIPIAIFEVVFGIWLLVKGVAAQPEPAIR